MGASRHTGALVSLALLASVVGHYAVHRHFSATAPVEMFDSSRTEHGHTGPHPDLGPLLFSSHNEPESSLIPRLLDGVIPPRPASKVQPALQELESDDADNPAVRRVIEDEMAGSSREERDIWYEELKSLPAGVVRDLLKVRKQLHALPRALHKADAPEELSAPAPLRGIEVSAEPASQMRRQAFPDWSPTMAALEQAASLSRHNVANSTTPGFKRLRWTLVDAYGFTGDEDATAEGAAARVSPIQADGCRLAAPLLDLQPGQLLKTGRPLDLAVDGDGFFVVHMNDKPCFTRCGALVLDSQRRLSLAHADESAVLQPVVTIPEDATEIQVSAKGEVLVLREPGTDPQPVGRIQLARFACPERLKPLGATLFAAQQASGEPALGEPTQGGRGAIQQGGLEQSNVDIETELADIERLQSLIKSLPVPARPLTASGSLPATR